MWMLYIPINQCWFLTKYKLLHEGSDAEVNRVVTYFDHQWDAVTTLGIDGTYPI